MKFPRSIVELPPQPYYAILTERTIHIPGDERSRTNPGHGYPASTENYLSMTLFEDKEKWEEEIIRLAGRDVIFQAIKVEPAQITKTTTIKVG